MVSVYKANIKNAFPQNKEIVDYILGFYEDEKVKKINENFNNPEFWQLKYIVLNYEDFENIYLTFLANRGIAKDAFFAMIVELHIDLLHKFIASYRAYLNNKQKNSNILRFLVKLVYWEDEKTINDMILLKVVEFLEESFPNYPGVDAEEKKKNIMATFKNTRVINQEYIVAYMIFGGCGELEQNALKAINTLINLYKTYYKPKIDKHNSGTRKNIYERFPDYPEVSDKDKVLMLNALFKNRSLRSQQLLQSYLERQINSTSYDGCKVRSIISHLMPSYDRVIKSYTDTILVLLDELDDIMEEKAKLLSLELILVEMQFKSFGYDSKKYVSYRDRVLSEIKEANPGISKQEIIKLYLETVKDDLRKMENSRN